MEPIKDSIGKISESLRMLSETLDTLAKEIKNYMEPREAAPKKVKPKVKKAKPVKRKASRAAKKEKKAVAPAKRKRTAPEVVLEIIVSSTGSVNVAALKEKTGYNDKKIANSIYRLKKQGKIKTSGRGSYTGA